MKLILIPFSLLVFYLYCVFADVQPQEGFDVQKFAGKWYRVAVGSNSPKYASYRDKKRTSMTVLTPQENGDVNAITWKQKFSGCYNKTLTYQKTEVPGRFTYICSWNRKTKELTVVETDYNEYAFMVKYRDPTKEFPHLSLYGRTEKMRPELIEKFRGFSSSQGIPKESVLVLPPALANCFPTDV